MHMSLRLLESSSSLRSAANEQIDTVLLEAIGLNCGATVKRTQASDDDQHWRGQVQRMNDRARR